MPPHSCHTGCFRQAAEPMASQAMLALGADYAAGRQVYDILNSNGFQRCSPRGVLRSSCSGPRPCGICPQICTAGALLSLVQWPSQSARAPCLSLCANQGRHACAGDALRCRMGHLEMGLTGVATELEPGMALLGVIPISTLRASYATAGRPCSCTR